MVKLNMNKFYTSSDNMYLETNRVKIQKENKPLKQSPNVNINTLLNRVKIEKKNEIKKNFLLLFLGVLAIIFSFFLL
tara:strand:+ start:62 stop:292 length:231 start_codon:yes stop_codon:yes gene_type:complete